MLTTGHRLLKGGNCAWPDSIDHILELRRTSTLRTANLSLSRTVVRYELCSLDELQRAVLNYLGALWEKDFTLFGAQETLEVAEFVTGLVKQNPSRTLAIASVARFELPESWTIESVLNKTCCET